MMKRSRLILASLVGGFYSLIIFLPEIHPILSLFLKLILSTFIVFVAFGFNNLNFFSKFLATFYIINFVFLGIMFLLLEFFCPPGIFIKNNVMYIGISPIFMVISTIISYYCFNFMSKLSAKKIFKKTFCNIFIKHNGKEAKLRAKIDTGNTLKEPFSSLPVMIVEYKFIENIIPDDVKKIIFNKKFDSAKKTNIRIVPFRAIHGNGILPAFKPDKIFIENKKGLPIFKNAYVGICKKGTLPVEFEALVSEELIN